MDLANRSAVWDKQLFKTCFGVSIMEGFLVLLFTALIIPAIAIAAACALVIFLSKILARINTKKDKKITPSAPEPVVRGDRYYLDIPSALNKWVQLQGAFRDPVSKKYYVVSQELKDRILEKLEKPFYKKRSIFSSHEAVNYKRLCAAAEPLGLEVFTKVGLSPTILKGSSGPSTWILLYGLRGLKLWSASLNWTIRRMNVRIVRIGTNFWR